MNSYELYRLDDGKLITGTLVWYAMICKREVWFMSKEITPDQDDPLLDIGRAVHETSYEQYTKEVKLEGIKIDIVKYKDSMICEIKTSSKFIHAARMQLLYYIYRLSESGIDVEGEILIPRERKKVKVSLDERSKEELINILNEIRNTASLPKPPSALFIPYCRRCAYRYFCWSI